MPDTITVQSSISRKVANVFTVGRIQAIEVQRTGKVALSLQVHTNETMVAEVRTAYTVALEL